MMVLQTTCRVLLSAKLPPLCAASLFHCSASLLSANVVHSGSSVSYSTSQEGRGTWAWDRIPDHKIWRPPSSIVHYHHSCPVSLFSPWALCILSFLLLLFINMIPDQALPLFLPWASWRQEEGFAKKQIKNKFTISDSRIMWVQSQKYQVACTMCYIVVQ